MPSQSRQNLTVDSRSASASCWVVGGPRPRQGDEARLTLIEGGPDVGAGTDFAELEAGVQAEGHVPIGLAHRHRVVAVSVVTPGAWCGPVVEHRQAHRHDVNLPRNAGGSAQDRPDPGADPGNALVASTPPLVAYRPDDEHVVDYQPPRRGVPCRLQHHRPRYVPAMVGHKGVERAKPEAPGVPVQERTEHARRVWPGQAEPLDRTVRCHQAVVLTVRQEPVVRDRRKGTHRRCSIRLRSSGIEKLAGSLGGVSRP